MSKEYIEKVTIGNPIGNLYRKNHVLVLLTAADGGFILCKKKNYYPDHISRMVGGGIKENEDPVMAARREIKEELQVDIPLSSFRPLCVVTTKADTTEGYKEMNTYIYTAGLSGAEKIKPGDDISGIEMYTEGQYEQLISEMLKLTGEYRTEAFSSLWSDWGKIYGPIHQFALDEYRLLS